MPLLELPLVLVQDILELVVLLSGIYTKIHSILVLREVNRLFEQEVTKQYARNYLHRQEQYCRNDIVDKLPRQFQIRLLSEYIGIEYRRNGVFGTVYSSEFCITMHAVLDFLVEERQHSDPSVNRHSVLLDICEALIRADFHYQILGKWKWQPQNKTQIQSTAFLIAIIMQWKDVQISMLKNTAFVDLANCKSGYLGFPVEMAIRLGYYDTVQLLAEAGAEIYEPPKASHRFFRNIVAEAARTGHLDVIQYLLYETSLSSQDGITKVWQHVAVEAAARQNFEISKAIVKKHGPNIENSSFRRVLCYAASYGNDELVHLVLDQGICPDNGNIKGFKRVALREAAAGGHLNTCRTLLENEAKKGLRLSKKNPIWRYAAMGGNVRIVELLDEYDIRRHDEALFLPIAVENGHLEFAKYAVSHRLHEGNPARTPEWMLYFSLLRAVLRDRSEIVSWFVKDLGVDPDGSQESCQLDGLTPLALAIDSGNCSMVKLLVELGATLLSNKYPGPPSTLTARLNRRSLLERARLRLNITEGQAWQYFGIYGDIAIARKAAARPGYDPGDAELGPLP